jgi:hypothetical protein
MKSIYHLLGAIAENYLKCNLDYIFGAGGWKFNKRSNKLNQLIELKQRG